MLTSAEAIGWSDMIVLVGGEDDIVADKLVEQIASTFRLPWRARIAATQELLDSDPAAADALERIVGELSGRQSERRLQGSFKLA